MINKNYDRELQKIIRQMRKPLGNKRKAFVLLFNY